MRERKLQIHRKILEEKEIEECKRAVSRSPNDPNRSGLMSARGSS